MKPTWWDKDFSVELKAIVKWLSAFFEGRIVSALKKDLSLSFKKFETKDAWEAARIKATKDEWQRLDAIQREFERTGKKVPEKDALSFLVGGTEVMRVQAEYDPLTPLQRALQKVQEEAEKQKKWGKMVYGEDVPEEPK